MYCCLTKRKNKMENLKEKVESAIIREKISTRGGGVEIDLGVFDDVWDGELMSAYQNYLGGGMLGSIQNDCTIDNWDNICIVGGYGLSEIAEQLRRYMHEKSQPEDEWAISFEDQQKMSVSAY